MTEPNMATPTGQNPDYNPEAVIARLRQRLDECMQDNQRLFEAFHEAREIELKLQAGLDELTQAYEQETEQLERVGGTETMISKEQRQLVRSQLENKRLEVVETLAHVALPKALDTIDEMEQALEAVANTECTNGRHFCKYCNSYTDETHRDYCVVAPVLGLPIEARASDE